MVEVQKKLVIPKDAIYAMKMFGSRRLNVHNRYSDYDVFCHISDVNIFECKPHFKDISNYGLLTPKHGKVFLLHEIPLIGSNNGAFLKEVADILIFEDRRDIIIVDKVLSAMTTAKRINYEFVNGLYSSKPIRIGIYNAGLIKNGFTDPTNIKVQKEYMDLYEIIERLEDEQNKQDQNEQGILHDCITS